MLEFVNAMMHSKWNRALVAALLTLVGAEGSFAQQPVGARAAGMAGAFVGVADDASAVYWNPAGIAGGSIVSVVLDVGQSTFGPELPQTVDRQRDTNALVALSATAMGFAYYRLGTYGISSAEPAVSGSQSREEVGQRVHLTTSTFGVSLLQSLGEHIVVGGTPKYIYGAGSRAFDVDAGVMLALNRVRFGLVGRNLTTPEFETGDGEDEVIELQREVRAGASWASGFPGASRLIVAVDGDIESRVTHSGDRRDVAAGVDTWWMNQRLGLRGGWRRSTIGEARAAFATGISVGVKPGMLVEAHAVLGHNDERSWSIGARMTY
jgi:hypothetical protein